MTDGLLHWNYRILREEVDKGVYYYGIYEVYYDENGDPTAWSAEPRNITAYHDKTELKELFKLMQQAFDKPTLKIVGDKLIS